MTDQRGGYFRCGSCESSVLMAGLRSTKRWTRDHGDRGLDILHIAAALSLQADAFLSFDERQKTPARAEGLRLAI